MQRFYQVKINGRVLESCDLKKLLSRAVSEKRAMDKRIRTLSDLRPAGPGGAELCPTLAGSAGSNPR